MSNGNSSGIRLNVSVLSLLVILAIQLGVMAYSYGALSARVAALEQQMNRQNYLLERYVFPDYG